MTNFMRLNISNRLLNVLSRVKANCWNVSDGEYEVDHCIGVNAHNRYTSHSTFYPIRTYSTSLGQFRVFVSRISFNTPDYLMEIHRKSGDLVARDSTSNPMHLYIHVEKVKKEAEIEVRRKSEERQVREIEKLVMCH